MRTALTGTLAMVVLGGCMGASGFQSKLAAHRGTAMYLHERRATSTERQPGTVSLGNFTVESGLPLETTVRKTGGYFVPALFVVAWKGKYQATLGATQIDNDYVQFMRGSLTEELDRSAKYAFVDRDGNVQLDVKVTRIEMNAPIVESDFAFPGFGRYSISAGPVDAAISGEIVARYAGKEVLRTTILGKSVPRPLRVDYNSSSSDRMMEDYAALMVEALSLAVKDFNEAVVATVNGLTLDVHRREPGELLKSTSAVPAAGSTRNEVLPAAAP